MLYICVMFLFIINLFFSLNIKKRKASLYAAVINLFILFVFSYSILQMYFATTEEDTDVDIIVVLGSSLVNNELGDVLKERMDKAIELINSNQDVQIILSGGITGSNKTSEAEAMKKYLIENDITTNIKLESNSKNTLENILYTEKLIENKKKKIAIVTSDYHLYRAIWLAKKEDWNVTGVGSKSEVDASFKSYIREILAIQHTKLKYYVTKSKNKIRTL